MTVVPLDHVVFTDLDGTEGVLVDLQSRQYYQLNETACVVWRGLAKRTAVSDIAKEITEIYDVTLEHAQESVATVIREFVARHLVRPV